MAIPLHKAVSSIESIQSSIETDRQVYRWFLMLITTPTIKTRICQSQDHQRLFAQLRWITLGEIAACLGLTAGLIYMFMTKERAVLLGGIALLFVLQKLYAANRQTVSRLSNALLTADLTPESLNAQTLYQICEHYAKTLNIPSLVDIIARQDGIARATLIYANIFACFIYPMDFWYIWVVIISSFYLMLAAVNTSLVFNRLK